MKSIYECPHCGEKTFNPITKAFAGQINSKGKVCKNCGRHCCNGMGSTIFHTITDLIALFISVFCYLTDTGTDVTIGGTTVRGAFPIIVVCILTAFVLNKIFDAFFLPLTSPARKDVF